VEVFLALVGGAFVLGIVVVMVRLSIKALGTPADRAAGNQLLQQTAALLGGRYRDRQEIPWYRRPAQYGAVEGELDGMTYHLLLMPGIGRKLRLLADWNVALMFGRDVSSPGRLGSPTPLQPVDRVEPVIESPHQGRSVGVS